MYHVKVYCIKIQFKKEIIKVYFFQLLVFLSTHICLFMDKHKINKKNLYIYINANENIA